MVDWFSKPEKLGQINLKALLAFLPGQFRFRPNAYQVRYAKAFIELLPRMRSEFGVDSDLKLAHFLAQGLYESGYFRSFEENLNYSAERIHEIWPKRFPTVSDAKPYAHNPKKLANKVYSGRMKNGDEASGDGWKYRGRGLIQLTGRANYRKVGEIIGLPLEEKPDLLRKDPKAAILAAVGFFQLNNLFDLAERNDGRGISRAVNIGNPHASEPAHGEASRLALIDRILQLIADPSSFLTGAVQERPEDGTLRPGDNGDDVLALQRTLNSLGDPRYNVGFADGDYGRKTSTAVSNFQQDNGLTADGVAGPQTLEALENAALIDGRRGDPVREAATPKDMAQRGVRQAQDGSSISGAGTVVGGAGAVVVGKEVVDAATADDDAAPTAEPLPDAQPEAAPPITGEPQQQIPADQPTFVSRGGDLDMTIMVIGAVLLLVALFIFLRGRRIARDTEQGYRAGRIS